MIFRFHVHFPGCRCRLSFVKVSLWKATEEVWLDDKFRWLKVSKFIHLKHYERRRFPYLSFWGEVVCLMDVRMDGRIVDGQTSSKPLERFLCFLVSLHISPQFTGIGWLRQQFDLHRFQLINSDVCTLGGHQKGGCQCVIGGFNCYYPPET